MSTASRSVIIVGAGVVGAAIAYHMAKRNIQTTIIDQHEPESGVTSAAFSWINVINGVNDDLSELRLHAARECVRLEQETAGKISVDWCGALIWGHTENETVVLVKNSKNIGHEVDLVERTQIQELEPALLAAPNVAAGTGSASLIERIGTRLPILASPSILSNFATRAPLIRRILSSPDFEIRQATPSSLLGADDYVSNEGENGPAAIARHTLELIQRSIRNGNATSISNFTVGVRPIPADGKPLFGFLGSVQNVYVATMHSGIILSAFVGRIAAGGIGLDLYLPDRIAQRCQITPFCY